MRFVKAATLDRLVDALVTDDGELESTFVNVFLGEFFFLSSAALFDVTLSHLHPKLIFNCFSSLFTFVQRLIGPSLRREKF